MARRRQKSGGNNPFYQVLTIATAIICLALIVFLGNSGTIFSDSTTMLIGIVLILVLLFLVLSDSFGPR